MDLLLFCLLFVLTPPILTPLLLKQYCYVQHLIMCMQLSVLCRKTTLFMKDIRLQVSPNKLINEQRL